MGDNVSGLNYKLMDLADPELINGIIGEELPD